MYEELESDMRLPTEKDIENPEGFSSFAKGGLEGQGSNFFSEWYEGAGSVTTTVKKIGFFGDSVPTRP